MKLSNNYMSALSGVMLLVVSPVLSVPRATNACDSKLSGTTKSISIVPESTTRLPVNGGFVARAKPANYSMAQATVTDTSDDISIDASFGDENISLERKKHRRPGCICHIVVISIIAVLVSKPAGDAGPPMIDLRATITGDDAVRGSLLYGLAWLAGDPDPTGSVRALGYDIDVSKQHDRPCTEGPASPVCVERSRRLATLLDATLALGSSDERALFQKEAAALGIAPDCSAAATTADSSVSRAASADSPEDLVIDASIGDRQIVLERKSGRPRVEFMDIRLKEVIITNVQPGAGHGDGASLNVRITGPDMVPGSLLYALAWLAGQPDPLGSVRALGYDIEVSIRHVHSCSNQRAGFTCEKAAHQLATLLDATLALGSAEERAQFRRDASVIGIAPDCSLREP